MISVVIPAHNEEANIGRCLERLLRDAAPDELDIVVACNGCSDATQAVAEGFGPPVRVVATERASKSAALNQGDAAARGFPRFYLDADIEIDTATVRKVAAVLEEGPALAAAPGLEFDLSESSPAVAAYYRLWMALPYVQRGLIGSGVYAVSEAGRKRFDVFPDIIADDFFVRNLFEEGERTRVEGCRFVARAAQTIPHLVNRKVRVFLGNLQLAKTGARRPRSDARWLPGWLESVLQQPALATSLPIYAYVNGLAKARAWWRLAQGDFATWNRDESTR